MSGLTPLVEEDSDDEGPEAEDEEDEDHLHGVQPPRHAALGHLDGAWHGDRVISSSIRFVEMGKGMVRWISVKLQ